MYSKAAILALVAPLACATITINPPTNVNSNSDVTITWTSSAKGTDPPVFSIELNNVIFHNSFAIANNVQTSAGTITVALPTVPAEDGYSIAFVNISNINDVIASTGQFNVGAGPSGTPSSTGSTASGSGSSAASVSVTTTGVRPTGSGFGTTVGSSATNTLTTGSTVTSSGSQPSSTTATSSSFNGAVSRSSNSYTALALSAFAGVALLAL